MKKKLYPYPKFIRRSFAAGVVMLMFTFCAAAQSHWALPSSRWEYASQAISVSSAPYPYHFCCELYVQKDTSIAGRACRKISGGAYDYYTFDSLGKAYIYLDGEFRKTWDFKAQKGDTLVFYRDTSRVQGQLIPASTPQFLTGFIDNVVRVELSGDSINLFYVHTRDSVAPYQIYSTYFVYADHVGLYDDSRTPFYPTFFDQSDVGYYYTHCNYGDSSFSNYWLYPTSTCATVGISDISLESIKLICYPNPSSGTFTIDMSGLGSGVKTVHIYDQLGHVVYSGESDGSEVTLNLRLAGGMYELEVMADRRSGRGKVVAE